MKQLMMFLGVLALCSGAAGTLAAQNGFVVIVNEASEVQELPVDAVSKMFFKRMTEWPNGQTVVPVDLPNSASIREAFSQSVHGKSVSAVTAFWNRQIFSGRGVPPAERATGSEVVAYVRSTPNAIGYVPTGTRLGSGVRAIRLMDR